MHFYTYDDWVAHAYSTTNQKDLSKGQTKIIDVTDKLGQGADQFTRINILSRFSPTVSVKSNAINPSFEFYSSKVDCDLGCLYKMKSPYDELITNGYKGSDCIQILRGAFGSDYASAFTWPYIHLISSQESNMLFPSLDGNECLTINVEPVYFDMFDKILIYQSIYSGCISYTEAQTSLEIQLGKMVGASGWNPNVYDYSINTNLYSATSLMIAGALITFDVSGESPNQQYNLIIENVSEFVYGHVDMAEKFGWNNLRWRSYQPTIDAKVMPDSIMHYSKN